MAPQPIEDDEAIDGAQHVTGPLPTKRLCLAFAAWQPL
jgi:hypothetical protein